MKTTLHEVCSFIGIPSEDTVRILAMQPKPVHTINWEHHSHSSSCCVKVFHADVDCDLGPRDYWVVTFEYPGGGRHCRVHWRVEKQWKRSDFRHIDVRLAVSQVVQLRMEKLVNKIMQS